MPIYDTDMGTQPKPDRCPTCKGLGERDCQRCSGNGCPDCHYQGVYVCQTCGGEGEL